MNTNPTPEMTPREKARIIIEQSFSSDERPAVLTRAVVAEAIRFATVVLLRKDRLWIAPDIIEIIRKDFLDFADEIHDPTASVTTPLDP